jgi:hypothetical protein
MEKIIGFENYTLDNQGNVYKNNTLLKCRIAKKDGKLYKSIRLFYEPKKYIQKNIATLVAEYFVKPKSTAHKFIIFKDRDTFNCAYTNLAWVDGETFAYYSGLKGGIFAIKKNDMEVAIATAKDIYLTSYYRTGKEDFLHQRFLQIDKQLSHIKNWNEIKSFCFIQFIERARRYSILGDAKGFVINYIKCEQHRLERNLKMCNIIGQAKF